MTPKLIPIELLSSRVFLSEAHQRHLFGDAHDLKILRPRRGLKGQFLYKETLRVLGSKDASLQLPVFGPAWEETVLELTSEDMKTLGIKTSATLQGPSGVVKLKTGIVAAASSLFASPEDARDLHLHNGDRVELCLSDRPTVTFEDVAVRVHPTYALQLELVSGEDASGLRSGALAQLVIS